MQVLKRGITWRTKPESLKSVWKCNAGLLPGQTALLEEFNFGVRLPSFAKASDEFCTAELCCPV